MKLLIVTQKVDASDPVLGFFHRWIREFASHCEKLTVICLEKGAYDLPENVRVLSMGKEDGRSRFKYIYRLKKHLWQTRADYDVVFVHMNPIYVVMAGWWWKLTGKTISLWYTHKSVDLKLKLATLLSDVVFTASRESFRYSSPKARIMGHGIDTEQFKPVPRSMRDPFVIITAGRISPVKNYGGLLDAMTILIREQMNVRLIVIGGPATTSDEKYYAELREKTRQLHQEEVIEWKGPIAHDDLPLELVKADVFVNLSGTGSLDKAGLEAMSCGLPVITSNEAFTDLLRPHDLMVPPREPEKLAEMIRTCFEKRDLLETIGKSLRAEVVNHHSLKNLIQSITDELVSISKK